jgi:hypothetical protein
LKKAGAVNTLDFQSHKQVEWEFPYATHCLDNVDKLKDQILLVSPINGSNQKRMGYLAEESVHKSHPIRQAQVLESALRKLCVLDTQ